MKIYIGHSTSTNYRENLYRPLKGSSLAEKHELIFPHDSEEFFNSRKFLEEECDLFIAEVSEASTGLGIELGWADKVDVPIICICREDSDPSSSLNAVTDQVHRYSDKSNLIDILEENIR